MDTKKPRKKQPELVRTHLLDAAAHVAMEKGLAALTLEGVAQRAGVSKGGLLHHFPCRQALIEALFKDILERLDHRIVALMAADACPQGRFTRAYIMAVTAQPGDGFESRLLGVTSLAMLTEPTLSTMWEDWMQHALGPSDALEETPLARILRYAADGIWLDISTCTPQTDHDKHAAIIAKLLALTHTL